MTFGFEPRGVLVHRAADLVQDVLQLGRLSEGALPLMAGGVPGQLVGCHVHNGAIVVHWNLPSGAKS